MIELIQAGPQVKALYDTWHPQPDPSRDWSQYLVVASFDGKMVAGYASALLLENGDFMLMETIVHPQHRRRGLAGWLMKARLVLAEELDAKRVVGGVTTPDAPMARVLRQFGFTETAEVGVYEKHLR